MKSGQHKVRFPLFNSINLLDILCFMNIVLATSFNTSVVNGKKKKGWWRRRRSRCINQHGSICSLHFAYLDWVYLWKRNFIYWLWLSTPMLTSKGDSYQLLTGKGINHSTFFLFNHNSNVFPVLEVYSEF